MKRLDACHCWDLKENAHDNQLVEKNQKYLNGSFHFLSAPPPKDGRIPTPQSLAAPFEEKNPKGSIFGGTFEKNFRRVNFLAAPLI